MRRTFGRVLTADVDKNINDTKSFGGRASLLFEPSDTVSLRLTALAQNIEADAPTVVESDPDTLKRSMANSANRSSCPSSRT